MVTEDERRHLLAIAREAIARALGNSPATAPGPHAGRLAEPAGAFVTIRRDGRLRGCIGYIDPPMPLANVVAEVAVKAARQDPRFPPVTPGELGEVELEVSILSPLQPVDDMTEIRTGEHGLLVECRGRRGLLLPRVAVEEGWDTARFLENTCRKAGLAPDAWKDPAARVYKFTAEVCDEEHSR